MRRVSGRWPREVRPSIQEPLRGGLAPVEVRERESGPLDLLEDAADIVGSLYRDAEVVVALRNRAKAQIPDQLHRSRVDRLQRQPHLFGVFLGQLGRRVDGDDPSIGDDRDGISQDFGFFHVMGREKDRLPAAFQLLEHVPDLTPSVGVEPGVGA